MDDAYNPFEGITPNLGPFDVVFDSPITILLALVWALAFAYVAFQLVVAIAAIVKARRSHRPDEAEEQGGRVVWPIVAIIGLAVAPVLYGILIGGLQGS